MPGVGRGSEVVFRIPLSFQLVVMGCLKQWIERRDTYWGGEEGCLVGVQADSLFMPGGRHLKENLYSFDGATDICVFLCLCVSLFVRASVECLAHTLRWGSQCPLFKLPLMSPVWREVLELIKFAWEPKSQQGPQTCAPSPTHLQLHAHTHTHILLLVYPVPI